MCPINCTVKVRSASIGTVALVARAASNKCERLAYKTALTSFTTCARPKRPVCWGDFSKSESRVRWAIWRLQTASSFQPGRVVCLDQVHFARLLYLPIIIIIFIAASRLAHHRPPQVSS